jgi:hypothetical protein
MIGRQVDPSSADAGLAGAMAYGEITCQTPPQSNGEASYDDYDDYYDYSGYIWQNTSLEKIDPQTKFIQMSPTVGRQVDPVSADVGLQSSNFRGKFQFSPFSSDAKCSAASSGGVAMSQTLPPCAQNQLPTSSPNGKFAAMDSAEANNQNFTLDAKFPWSAIATGETDAKQNIRFCKNQECANSLAGFSQQSLHCSVRCKNRAQNVRRGRVSANGAKIQVSADLKKAQKDKDVSYEDFIALQRDAQIQLLSFSENWQLSAMDSTHASHLSFASDIKFPRVASNIKFPRIAFNAKRSIRLCKNPECINTLEHLSNRKLYCNARCRNRKHSIDSGKVYTDAEKIQMHIDLKKAQNNEDVSYEDFIVFKKKLAKKMRAL